VAKLTEELTSLKLTVAELEKERDFYFGKLRDVEITCQTHERTEVPKIPIRLESRSTDAIPYTPYVPHVPYTPYTLDILVIGDFLGRH